MISYQTCTNKIKRLNDNKIEELTPYCVKMDGVKVIYSGSVFDLNNNEIGKVTSRAGLRRLKDLEESYFLNLYEPGF